MILAKDFFKCHALRVAPGLIGKYLVRQQGDDTHAYMITEVEAYIGPHDKACHAHKGRTKRTEVMFGPAGHWYIYFIYGMYDMLNIVTDKDEYPSAVLIRGVEGIAGPGRLTKQLGITRELNKQLAVPKSGLWIEDRGVVIPQRKIIRTPRIGVAYAQEWAQKPYRFVLKP